MAGVNIPIRATDYTGPPTRAASGNFFAMQRRITASTARTVKALGAFSSVALAGSGAGLVFFGKTVFQTTARLESMRIALAAASGDNRVAASDFAFLEEQANRLGLSLEAMVSTYGKYTAAAQGAGLTAQQTRDSFLAVSEAAAVMGLSSESTRLTLKALEQMLSKGRVQSEELRGQLGEHLPNAFQLAAKSMGMTTEAFSKALEQGQILGRDLVPKLAATIKAEWGDQVPKAMTRAQAGIERFKNEWTLLLERIGQGGFGAAVADTSNDLAAMLRNMRINFGGIERFVIKVVAGIKAMGSVAGFVAMTTRSAFGLVAQSLADALPRAMAVFKADVFTGVENVAHAFRQLGAGMSYAWNLSLAKMRGVFGKFASWVAKGFEFFGMDTEAGGLRRYAENAAATLDKIQKDAAGAAAAELQRHHEALASIQGDLIATLDGLGTSPAWGRFTETAARNLGVLISEFDRILGEADTSLELSRLFEDNERFERAVSRYISILTEAKDPTEKFQTLLAAIEAKAVSGMTGKLADDLMALNDAMDAMLNRKEGAGPDDAAKEEQERQNMRTMALMEGVSQRMRVMKMWYEWEREEERKQAEAKATIESTLLSLREKAANRVIGLLQTIGQRNKAFALAALIVQKAVAIAQINMEASKALMAAKFLAYSTGNPTAYAGFAADINASRALNIGLVAATGVAEAVNLNSGAGSSTGGVPPSSNTVGGPGAVSGTDPQQSVIVQNYFHGDVYGMDDFENRVVESTKRYLDRDGLIASRNSNSRQASEFKA